MRSPRRIPFLLAPLLAAVLAACSSGGQEAVTVTSTVGGTTGSSAATTSGGGSSSAAPGTSGSSRTTAPPRTSGSAGSSAPSASSSASRPPASSAPASSTPASTRPGGRPASNVPMTKLKPGEKAPQFVIFSFDGAGSHEKWQQFMAAAKPTDSRFVGFLTGIYLVSTASKNAYTGPGHAPGKASIGFGGTKEEIVTEINDLNQAYRDGHEIGTHYNGHFCAGNEPSGKDWDTADWDSEIGQFMKFLTDYRQINGWGTDVPELLVKPSDIKGGRTPCLEGVLDEMAPAWKKYGFTYDSSLTMGSGISWPTKVAGGIWEFQMPYVYSPGFQRQVLAMDYNFWVAFNQGKDQPETAPELRQKVRATYDYMFQQAYQGNRAPVLIANHFNTWNGDSFNPPALDFMKETCGKDGVYCTTYQDVIAWMELQDPAVLQQLQGLPPVALGS